MPIPKHVRWMYETQEWRTVTRPAVLTRAGNCCEHCGAPAGALYWRYRPGPPDEDDDWHTPVVQLGIAHLNHTPGDDRLDNLKALCRGCHLAYDAGFHKRTRSIRKDSARPLLAQQEVSF